MHLYVYLYLCGATGISVYNVVVLCLIGVPTAFMIKEQIDAAYTLTSLFTFFATTLTICLVFIPKVNGNKNRSSLRLYLNLGPQPTWRQNS